MGTQLMKKKYCNAIICEDTLMCVLTDALERRTVCGWCECESLLVCSDYVSPL